MKGVYLFCFAKNFLSKIVLVFYITLTNTLLLNKNNNINRRIGVQKSLKFVFMLYHLLHNRPHLMRAHCHLLLKRPQMLLMRCLNCNTVAYFKMLTVKLIFRKSSPCSLVQILPFFLYI